MSMILVVDTGPLVALFEARDQHHGWAVDALRIEATLITCEAVLSETCFLLGRGSNTPPLDALFQLISEGGLRVEPLGREIERVRALMARYRSVPMSFADACLVRLAELHPRARVMTADSDFAIYRREGRRVLSLLAPWG